MNEVVVGIDLGGTNAKTAVITKDREVLGKESRPTNAQAGPDAVMDVMRDGVEAVLTDAGVSKSDVLAVCVASPGPLNWQTGIVFELPNLPGWRNVPLAESMQKRLDLPCFLDNDANVACYGEYWLGAGQGCETMAVLTLGTGVGGGIVLFGQLLRGIDGTAAELGHLKVLRDGRPCGCGGTGCLEAYASVTGMVRTAVEAVETGKDTLLTELCGKDLTKLTGKMISDAAEQEDEVAKHVMHETGVWIGLGCASLINMLNPEKIVLCGGMIAAGDALFGPVRATAKEQSFDVPADRCQIVPAGLGGDAGVIGAAGCALARYQEAS